MTLTWEARTHRFRVEPFASGCNLEEVTLGQIYDWTLQIQEFEDDPTLCNDDILSSIYQEWFEEYMNAR